jgi:hypothetical protein
MLQLESNKIIFYINESSLVKLDQSSVLFFLLLDTNESIGPIVELTVVSQSTGTLD